VDEPPEEPRGNAPGRGPDPLQAAIDGQEAEAVREAVAALPPLQREAVVLFEYQGMTLADVATVCETDVGTIKSRLHRARERLRRTLRPLLSGGSAAAPAGGA
jgi:RNA polymerase sigma-70 factor (ECF subfamily)